MNYILLRKKEASVTYRSLFSKWANKVKNIESEKKCLWVVDPEKIILYMPLDHRKSKGITKEKKIFLFH